MWSAEHVPDTSHLRIHKIRTHKGIQKEHFALCSLLNVSAPLCIWTGTGIWEKRSHDCISFSLTFDSKNSKFFKDRDKDAEIERFLKSQDPGD